MDLTFQSPTCSKRSLPIYPPTRLRQEGIKQGFAYLKEVRGRGGRGCRGYPERPGVAPVRGAWRSQAGRPRREAEGDRFRRVLGPRRWPEHVGSGLLGRTLSTSCLNFRIFRVEDFSSRKSTGLSSESRGLLPKPTVPPIRRKPLPSTHVASGGRGGDLPVSRASERNPSNPWCGARTATGRPRHVRFPGSPVGGATLTLPPAYPAPPTRHRRLPGGSGGKGPGLPPGVLLRAG